MSKKKKQSKIPTFVNVMASLSVDPMGTWTGAPIDPNDVPVQDVDDL